MVSNDSITIMQKVEELKQWQKQYQARQGQSGGFHSPSSGKQERVRDENNMFIMSSPSIQLRAPENLTVKSDILDLDNGIHMIDELLNRIQRKSTEPPHNPSPSISSNPAFQRPSLPASSPPQRFVHPPTNSSQRFSHPPSSPPLQRPSFTSHDNSPPSQRHFSPPHDSSETRDYCGPAKPKRPYLRRGEGLSRFRMTLDDLKKPPITRPSVVSSRVRKKPAFQPVAAQAKRPSTSQSEVSKPPSSASSRPDLLSKAALTHLETWSNMFGSDQGPNQPAEGGRYNEPRTNAPTVHRGPNSDGSRPDAPTTVRYPNDQNARSTLTSDRIGPRSNIPPSERYPNHQNVKSNIFGSDQGLNGRQPVEMSPLTQHRTQISLDLDRRKKKETEEQKVFELLEQRTRDSSFNSTSSMVAKLMEDSVMSTPVKGTIARPQNPSSRSGQESGRTDRGSHVRFTDGHEVQTIEEVDESGVEDRTHAGFTIEQLPGAHPDNTEDECVCESECDTQYCSSDEGEGGDIPSVDEAIKSYRTVLNKPCVDSGKPSGTSRLDDYLKLVQPLRSPPPNPQPKAHGVQTNNNAVVKETKQLLAEIKKLQDERIQRENEDADKENESRRSNRGGKKGPGFPMTVYQETFQKPGGKGAPAPRKKTGSNNGGLKSFGAEDLEPNPFEQKTEASLQLDLLKRRLGDLENEIHVFRLENIKLNKERKEFEKDKAAFTRAKKASEKSLQEERDAFAREMEEEKNKLNREKKVFLKCTKDARNFPSKQEREELSKLREELRALKEESVKKETRWAAGQARLRNHVKVLEAQNLELKVQVEKLGKEAKKVSFASKKHISNTQIMNAINSQISKLTKSDVLPPPPPTSILKKTSAPSTTGPTVQTNQSPTYSTATVLPHSISPSQSVPSSYNLTVTPRDKESPMPEDSFDRVIYQSLYSGDEKKERGGSEETPSHDNDVIPIESLNLGSPVSAESAAEYKEVVTGDGTRERHYSDGRQEIHYPNGNTLIVSEAGKYIKMFYYNGDIKETDNGDGTVRYFYSETNTWHTTQPDGTEVLEFCNGQRETRHRDGRVEIEYGHRGCRRLIGNNGTELWRFDEGPVETVEILEEGQRILKLRNGQKEIHTRDYKRREFPDGAVKLVYPDGIQETRYPNGRIRLKDADGNLIMDSHEM